MKLTSVELRALLTSGEATLPGSRKSQRAKTTRKTESDLTGQFLTALRLAWPDCPELVAQHHWAKPERKFRADFAHVQSRTLIELEGGIFGGGAHGSIEGMLRDIDRSQWAAALGWRVFRLSTKDLDERPMQTIELLRRAIEREQ